MEKILSLDEFKTVFDKQFFKFLKQKEKQASKIDKKCALLVGEIIRLNKAGGKRLRPYMAYLGFCLGENDKDIYSIFKNLISVEFLQSFALIHDDIMDEAKLRRRELSTYAKHGRDIAILVGDMAISLADETMGGANDLAKQAYDQLKFEVICGQFLDVGFKVSNLDKKSIFGLKIRILKIYQYKSGLYTVARPLQIGYLLTNKKASQKELAILKKYGVNIGIIFQTVDDLLDLYASPKFGKVQGGDVKEGKLTLWLVELLGKINKKDKLRLKKALGNKNLNKKEINWIKDLVKETRAKQACQDYINSLMKTGQRAIMNFLGNKEAKQSLFNLANFIAKRDY